MISVYGHERNLTSLHRYLPRVSMFVGPYSVGKWTTAEHLRQFYSIEDSDVLRVRQLTPESAQGALEFSLTPPARSTFKLIIVDLYQAERAAQAALSRAADDSRNAKIIIVNSGDFLHATSGLTSRSVTYLFNALSSENLSKVLQQRYQFGEDRANDLASRAGGQVYRALQISDAEQQISTVRVAVRAIRTHDEDALNDLAGVWTDETTAWLTQWANENLSQHWAVFDIEDAIDGHRLPLLILMATRDRVRPKLVVRSQLMGVLRGEL